MCLCRRYRLLLFGSLDSSALFLRLHWIVRLKNCCPLRKFGERGQPVCIITRLFLKIHSTLRGENMNCGKRKISKILFLGLFSTLSALKCQIPATGSDLPSLSKLHWGMNMQEVNDRIGRHAEGIGDTSLAFPDSFQISNVQVMLTFGTADGEKGLKLVEVQFDRKNAEKLRSYLITHYGKNYETEKKEKTKLFFTVRLEASKWHLISENIMMMVFSHGDDVLSLSLLYNRKGK